MRVSVVAVCVNDDKERKNNRRTEHVFIDDGFSVKLNLVCLRIWLLKVACLTDPSSVFADDTVRLLRPLRMTDRV